MILMVLIAWATLDLLARRPVERAPPVAFRGDETTGWGAGPE